MTEIMTCDRANCIFASLLNLCGQTTPISSFLFVATFRNFRHLIRGNHALRVFVFRQPQGLRELIMREFVVQYLVGRTSRRRRGRITTIFCQLKLHYAAKNENFLFLESDRIFWMIGSNYNRNGH